MTIEPRPADTVRALLRLRLERRDVREWTRATPALTQALRALTPDEATRLAQELWPSYEFDRICFILGQLNATALGSLVPLHTEFIAQERFYPGWLYLGASSETAAQLLKRLESAYNHLRIDHLLKCLAWIDDEIVLERFRAWRDSAPPWQADLHVPAEDYLLEAGCELTPDGQRRLLYRRDCYELAPIEPQGSDSGGEANWPEVTDPTGSPVQVWVPHEAACTWCGRQLVTLLDIDLTDPRCAFLAADQTGATRVRIAHCWWCSPFSGIFTDIDAHGASRWSDANGERPEILAQIDDGSVTLDFTRRRLALGVARRTPFEALGRLMLDQTGSSQLGGHPDWVNDATYPVCPSCGRRMECVGQVSWDEIGLAEGMNYACVCLPCGKATTVYQQS